MTAPPSVPVFNCVVNVSPKSEDGLVTATVANLAGIASRGRTEREALAQTIPLFKETVARLHAAGQPIPWINPPTAPGPGETRRLIAVHL
jgi:hypothetical protein